MLIELRTRIEQEPANGHKRWFQDDYFDLFTWQNDIGQVTAFQLCYDRVREERVIYWRQDKGFEHHRVDGGESAPHKNMTPVFVADGLFSYDQVIPQFIHASKKLERAMSAFIVHKLIEYSELINPSSSIMDTK